MIAALPNGPYYYFTDFEPKPIDGLTNSKGETLSNLKGTALCRCGASDNKPFCVGAHSKIGFSDRKETDGHLDKRIDYVGNEVTIHDNRGICSHVGYCTDNLPSVFKLDEEPWIDPNGASKDEIIETIKKCPSGALSYSVSGKEHRDQDRDPLITASKNGPYFVTGWVVMTEAKERAEKVSEEHFTLCRCGSSKNKPFCDGTHWSIGFKDEKN
ncbi:MAG: CDGSH iron-sulfur domain-containing protein [Nitrospirota bacterium]|nr:MAG: CDGSH iron-sulfur domain-containing protein [Nitrospirota bacterium]